jgi:signal transduction histidine kinase
MKIRTRLLVVYLGVILAGFSVLTVIAGGQINTAVHAEYEQHLQDEIRLIAQGLASSITTDSTGQVDLAQVQLTLQNYAPQTEGKLTAYSFGGAADNGPHNSPGADSGPTARKGSFFNMPEMETALRGEIVLVERTDDTSVDTFYTAAPIGTAPQYNVIIQLGVPVSNLNGIILQRWAVLGLGFLLVTTVALLAALWLSHTIIQPLYRLRDSALQLSHGDLSHRVSVDRRDEIGEVGVAFNEMANQVQSMLEEQRAFASNTSHELRTPLTAIQLRAEALIDDPTLDAETTKRYIQGIADEIARMSNLIQDLTLLSRFDAGQAKLGQEEIDFVRLANNLSQLYVPQAQDKNITLTLEVRSEPILMRASISHLTVVFRNILENALKYTPNGGSIYWTIQTTDAGILYTIKDTGQGISASDLPHIYERFFRADKAHSRNIPGTGLGLSLVKSIVDAYHGWIQIESAGSGKGTTVTILWPTHVAITS